MLLYKMNKLRNIVITFLLLMTSFLSADCVDSAGIFNNSCAILVGNPEDGGFGMSCDTYFGPTLIAEACPVTCNTCPGVCPSDVCEWDETYMTCPEDCDPPSACDAAVCLNITNVHPDAETLDIHMTNQEGCSYCTDNNYDNKVIFWQC